METKICKKCLEEKELSDFYKQKRNKDGRWNTCILCEKNKYKENSKVKKQKVSEYRQKNPDKVSESKKKYYYSNIEKILEQKKLYGIKNRDKRNKKAYTLYHNDPVFKLLTNLRTRTRIFINASGLKKNSKTIEILGANPEVIKEYIEKQFTEGMSWENYGLKGWHIDHIVLLSSAKKEEEIYKLCHYTNLQPLWAQDNIKKGNKLK